MLKKLSFIGFLLSVILGLSTLGLAQRTTGDVQGTTKDPKGAVVPGVSVTLTGANVGYTRTVTSDSDGRFQFLQVPAGTYNISTAAANGFAATNTQSVTVNLEQTTLADLTLGIAGSVNTVEVSGDPLGVNVDTTESKVQTNITAKLIDELPKGANFSSLIKVAPGARPEPLSGGIQVDGASGSENSFVIDGQALENFRTGVLDPVNNIPSDMVQEIQIKTGGFEAEHGGASGAVISVVTKSGSDSLHGEFGMQFEAAKLQAGNSFTPSLFQSDGTSPQYLFGVRQPKSDFLNTFPTASLGGPIVKGRLWFYGNWSPQRYETNRTTDFYDALGSSNFVNTANGVNTAGVNLVRSSIYPRAHYHSTTTYEYGFARLDANVMNNLRVSGTFLWNPNHTEGAIPYGGISVGGTPINNRVYNGATYTDEQFQALKGGRTTSNNTTAQVVYTPTSNLVATFRYGRAYLNEKNGNYAVPIGTRYQCTGLSGATAYAQGGTGCTIGFDTGLNALAAKDISLRNEYNGDVSYSVANWGGRHEFKGGIQYGTTTNDVKTSFSGATPINDPFYGRVLLYYGRNFDTAAGIGSLNPNCNLRTTANPTGDCLGVGLFYRYGTQGVASNRYIGLFFQDKWQVTSRLTLNLGVRAENENLPAFNTGNGGGGIPLSFGFGQKWVPRLGFAYDLKGDGHWKLYGSYGKFTDRLKFELPRGSFGGDFYRFDYFPISAAHPDYSFYTRSRILGSWGDPIGGGNPSTAGGLSIIQLDFRIPSNITESQATALGLPFAGIDPNLKPFKQSELTFGFEHEFNSRYVLSARYTRKNVDSAIEDHGILGANGSENYIISNPGEGKALQLDTQAGYIKSLKPQRLYNGVEVVLNRRLSNHYFYNVNYTWSRLYGNYSGLASSDEGGRTSPGVSRYFDYIVNGFTYTGQPDNGLLATDRTHTLKAYGGYDFDWRGSKTNSTELSFFQQVLQGTPQTTYMGIYQSDIVYSHRGDLGRTPTFWQTDLSLQHRYRFGRDNRFAVIGEINVLNAFNNHAVTGVCAIECRYSQDNVISFDDIDPTYTDNPVKALNAILSGQFTPAKVDATLAARDGGNPRSILYGQPISYQAGRNVRFGFRLQF